MLNFTLKNTISNRQQLYNKYKKIIFIILTVIIFGCDGPYKNCDEHYFSDEYKAYTFFNEGSYWVYQDTLYNKIDSINLLYHSVKLNNYCDYNTPFEELLEQHFYSSFFQTEYDYFVIHGSASEKVYNYTWDYPMGFFSDWTGTSWMVIENLDSIQINNNWYKDIKIFTDGKYKSYWSKNIGLIKKVIPYPYNSDTIYNFEILRYHIN